MKMNLKQMAKKWNWNWNWKAGGFKAKRPTVYNNYARIEEDSPFKVSSAGFIYPLFSPHATSSE